MCLPPHSTHESQPLDASVFKPLKQNWNDACSKFMQQNPGKVITKYNFSPLLNEAWNKTMVPKVMTAGFKRCGIYPFNPDVIDYGVPANDDSKPSNSNTSQKAPLDAVTSRQLPLDFASNRHLPIYAVTSQQLPLGAIDSEDQATFSSEQEQLFQKRYEEQYDLPDPVYQQWLKINHPTTELVKENQMIKVIDPELSLEQEQEEYDNFPDPFADWPQEDQVEFSPDLSQEDQVEFAPNLSQEDQVEFSPEQVLLFQKRFKEQYDVPDPVYQQWLKINHPTTAAQVHNSQMFEFTSDQDQRRFEENYDLPDPVYQQWLKINHPTAQPAQKEPLGQSSEVGDAVSHQRDVFHDFSSEVVHQDQAAHSANNFSPELEQSYQRVFEDPSQENRVGEAEPYQ